MSVTEAWEGQYIDNLPLESLVLWSENPRDPLDPDADNEQIIENALHGKNAESKWNLYKLAKQMGPVYDLSQLPIVSPIPDSEKYLVFDGNRRVILAMLKTWNAASPLKRNNLPLFPETIPCNVCTKEVAINLVYQRHNEKGSWSAYDRDVFAARYMGQPDSLLVRIEKLVNGITRWPALNHGYVRDDILNAKHLIELGLDSSLPDFGVSSGVLEELLEAVAAGIKNKSLNTRGSRNDPIKELPEELVEKIKDDVTARSEEKMDYLGNTTENDEAEKCRSAESVPAKDAQQTLFSHQVDDSSDDESGLTEANDGQSSGGASLSRRTRSTKAKSYPIFNGPISLQPGEVNNLYRTMECLWNMNEAGQIRENSSFISLFRMGLRLIAETAAQDEWPDDKRALVSFINEYASDAKKRIKDLPEGQDILTFLSANSVTSEKLQELLQLGAHGYTASNNMDQALAISILLAEMLKLSHGK